MINRLALTVFLLIAAGSVSAQCAPGIPSAGNPTCIPPNQTNSPYHQGPAQGVTPPEPKVVFADRWGAIALDTSSGSVGYSTDETSKQRASRAAIADCQTDGSRNCEVLTSYYNQCAAISQDDGGGFVFAAAAPQVDEAKRTSLKNCGKATCSVVYSNCVHARRVQ